MSQTTPTTLLAAINRQLGAELEVAGRFAGGEQGAYRVIDRAGAELVLKWGRGAIHFERLRAAAATTAHLRALGYPASTYRAIGQALGLNYSLQQVLRQVEWSARHHDRSTVAMWLERAMEVLRDLAAL
jgi:hypothetical protein